MKNKPRVIEAVCFVIYIVALAVDTALMGLFQWFEASFGVTFREIIYTVKSPLSGANSNFLAEALRYVLPKLIPFALLLFPSIRDILVKALPCRIPSAPDPPAGAFR